MGSPSGPLDLTLSDLEQTITQSLRFEGLYLEKRLNYAICNVITKY